MAEELAVEGFTLLFRLEEIWPLLARGQAFPNWFTKLHLCCIFAHMRHLTSQFCETQYRGSLAVSGGTT